VKSYMVGDVASLEWVFFLYFVPLSISNGTVWVRFRLCCLILIHSTFVVCLFYLKSVVIVTVVPTQLVISNFPPVLLVKLMHRLLHRTRVSHYFHNFFTIFSQYFHNIFTFINISWSLLYKMLKTPKIIFSKNCFVFGDFFNSINGFNL